MDPAWHEPEEWAKDGSTISGITGLKTGAWTALYTAKETVNGKSTDIILKTFSVPEGSLHDERKIKAEHDRFLVSARLQQSLVKEGAQGWVDVLKVSEEPPAFTMPKFGPSLQDLLEHKISLTAKELYAVLQSVLQALIELKQKHDRSHGDLKPSNVLASATGVTPAYKLADPTPKGESHSANDLYSLGLILYQLIEHKEYDALTQITPSKNWTRLGARRDRWIQFLNLLLSPNGCQDSLTDVRKEALRLRPSSRLRPVMIGAAGLVLLAGVGYGVLTMRLHRTVVSPSPEAASMPRSMDPAIKAAYDKAKQTYQGAHIRWLATTRNPRYDHTKSVELARDSRTLLDEVTLTDAAGYSAAVELYEKAAAKLEEAIVQANAEEAAGKVAEQAAMAELQQAQQNYNQAEAAWTEAAAKFTPAQDHSHSKALAEAAHEAAQSSAKFTDAAADPAARRIATEQFKTAAGKLTQALGLIPDENRSMETHAQALALFKKAREDYRVSKERWEAFQAGHKNLDLSEASQLADEAQKDLSEPLVLTDDASYRAAAERAYEAAQKNEQALAMAGQAKPMVVTPVPDPVVVVKHPEPIPDPSVVKTPEKIPEKAPEKTPEPVGARGSPAEIAAAVARADGALKAKNYGEALADYKKAADLGSAAAGWQVGMLYETGTGTARDYAQAAAAYKKAAAQNYVPAILNLASLYQKGKGVDQNNTQALNLYRQGAELNNADAMVALGSLYENGQGTEQNYGEALKWYKKAAELKNPAAITNVGVFYEMGKGVPVDYKEALGWYSKAAALNYPPGMNDLAVLYDSGRYDNGKDIKPNPAEAAKWYTKAADLGFPQAMCNLGALYDNGQGVALDHAEARRWFLKAAERNHPMAMYNLGVLYETGRGVQADTGEAVTWYRKAAHSDDPTAQRLALDSLSRLGFGP